MSNNDSYSREKERLEEIVLQTRAKDVPLEKSLDLYDEAIAIGTRCVEQLEKTDFTAEELESLAQNPEVELSGRVTEHPEVESDDATTEESEEALDDEVEDSEEALDDEVEDSEEEYDEEDFEDDYETEDEDFEEEYDSEIEE